MGCSSCSTGKDGKPGGCKSNGSCSTGGCNRLNTYDWMATMDIRDTGDFDIVEVSFKNGARKNFFHNPHHAGAIIGDIVVVESASGYDMGHISLTGELVRLQMKKKRVSEEVITHSILRKANHRDLERLEEARNLEMKTMVNARIISRTLGLDMKIGDVEYQGDKRKATFYYTAEGRVDFRELIRHFAKDFRVKIEMRQIGARQESARIGGLGSCGRELCCSTWLSDFKSVSTAAARYQNLAINQAKLSGQCGRLKCCLNFELDTYMDALESFPRNADRLRTEAGQATLAKTDIFKGLMFYYYETKGSRGQLLALDIARVKEIQEMNKRGEAPLDLVDIQSLMDNDDIVSHDFEDVTGVIELPPEERQKKRRNRNRNRKKGDQGGNRSNKNNTSRSKTDAKAKPTNQKSGAAQPEKKEDGKPGTKSPNNNKRRRGRNNRNKKNPNKPGNAKNDNKGANNDKGGNDNNKKNNNDSDKK